MGCSSGTRIMQHNEMMGLCYILGVASAIYGYA